MSRKKNRSSNFIIQGSILAIAGLIVRIIGIVYRIPMTNIIGDEGMGYYSFAYEPYAIMLLLSYQGLPTAVSKMVAEFNASGRFRNSYRVFKTGMVIAIVIGAVTASITWFGAWFIAGTMNNQPMSAYALKVLAPTIFVLSIMGILRGYFQGMGTMVPTAVSQIIEAIANAIISVAAASYLFTAGHRFDLVRSSASHAEAYGAAGGTLGTFAGAVAALTFLCFVFVIFRPTIKKQVRKDRIKEVLPYREIGKAILLTSTPLVVSSVIYNVSTSFDGMIFSAIMQGKYQIAKEVVAANWGIFTNKYKIMIMIPVAIASALATSIIPDFSEDIAAKNKARVLNKITYAIRFSMIVAMPCAVGLGVLAKPIMSMLFGSASVTITAVRLLQFGCIAAVLYSLSTVSNAILQGINQMNKPLFHAVIALIAHLLLLALLVGIFKADIYGVMIAYLAFGLIMCVLNALAIRKTLFYRQEYKKSFFIPGVCSLIMGVAVFGIYTVIYIFTKKNTLSTFFAILAGAVIYMVLMLLTRGITENDLHNIPMGEKLIYLFQKIHLLK